MLRHAVRTLLKSPGTSVPIVVTLATAIALVTALFSLVNGYAWRELPYEEADRVVALGVRVPRDVGMRYVEPADLDLVRALPQFSGVAAHLWSSANVSYTGAAVRDRLLHADAALFELLRAVPVLGRVYDPDAENSALLSFRAWQLHFEGASDVLGRVVHIDGRAHVIAGVLPEHFTFGDAALYVPFEEPVASSALARLADGVSADAALVRLEAIAVNPDVYEENARLTLDRDMIQRDPLMQAGAFLVLFFIATASVVLIASSNVVALLLARSVARRQEFAVRAALGASRMRLLTSSLCEAGILTLTAALVGILLSTWLIDVFVAVVPAALPPWLEFGIDWRVLGFGILVALLCTAAVGWLPAREAANPELQIVLKTSGAVGVSARRARFSRILVATELALAVALFSTTVLLARSAARLTDVDLGYDATRVVALDVEPPASAVNAEAGEYHQRLIHRLATVPGVEEASWRADFEDFRTATDTIRNSNVRVILDPLGERVRGVRLNVVGGNYVATLGLEMDAGRMFTAADDAGAPPVAILTRDAARRIFGDQPAVGRTFVVDTIDPVTLTVIGLVESPRKLMWSVSGGYAAEPEAVALLPASQALPGRTVAYARGRDAAALVSRVAASARALDTSAAIENVESLHARETVRLEVTTFAAIMGSIAAVALALALIGLYGVIAYSTARRTGEFGLRLALGAAPARIARDVAADAGRTVVAGLIAGFVLALALGQLITVLLYDVVTADALTFAVVAVCFSLIALLAVSVPIRRVLRTDPLMALRSE